MSTALNSVWNDVVRGDLQSALATANAIDPQTLSSVQRDQLKTFFRRTKEGVLEDNGELEALPEVMASLIRIYRAYWLEALKAEDHNEAEPGLRAALGAYLEMPGADWPEIADAITKRTRDAGYIVLQGCTLPLFEFMAWKTQGVEHFEIALPHGQTRLPVRMLRGFVSYGWCRFLTGNARGTGGWVADDHLCCLEEFWDTSNEGFKVSYLGHEAQHHSDRQELPWLEQPELEYRAKLTELVLATETQRNLLTRFGQSHTDTVRQGSLPARHISPHTLGEYWLIGDLEALVGCGWESMEPDALRKHGRRLLLQSRQRDWRGCPEQA